ncbi:Ff.00g135280.m01.CDS01 [Fusarium sp. VM40]|nr:Ff.00g135280.m01.CDS01 [Fusarium sp. VM40]
MKAPRACYQCRGSKRKCVRPGPGQPCNSCMERGRKCSAELQSYIVDPESAALSPVGKDKQAAQSSPSHTAYNNAAGLPWNTTQELVDLYLDMVHHRPHSIFHPPTLRTQLHEGTVPGALLCAICAIGSKFSPDPDRKALEARLTEQAKSLLQADIENICVENIQTCILVATICAGNSQTSSEALFVRIAISMAEIMHIASTDTDESIIMREIKRRIWWSLCMADHWCFSALGMPRPTEGLDGSYDLPMDEITFHSLLPNHETPLAQWKPGLWAHMVRLVRFFGPIQDLNRRIAKGDTDILKLDKAVESLSQQLDAWSEMLPCTAQMTVQNLYYQQQNGLGGPFVTLHLTYHYYSTLLYFRFLESQNAPSSTQYITRCKHHASSFSSLLHLSHQVKGCGVDYSCIGHMTAVSSSVLVHTLLFGESQELQKARRELNTNFEALMELLKRWPVTEAMVTTNLPQY